ncbi:MAG: NAD-dependent protein deacylase [Stutzerimonas stutzeri]|nr:MAG: NAD-dependent protein deacylase [Stutzerimonas stutzeri]
MTKIIVFTGAGISADSGLQTYRGADGIWADERLERICNFRVWKQHRLAVHEFYNARRADLRNVQPNAAHAMVARLQETFNATLITQNVDDLHDRAAAHIAAAEILHVHGRLTHMMCTTRGCEPWFIGHEDWDADDASCPHCNSIRGVKPDVVLFGENAPHYQRMWKLLSKLTAKDILIVIGTSGKVIDIGSIAAKTPATTILSNLESSPDLSMPGAPCVEDRQFDHVIHGRAIDTAIEIESLVHQVVQRGARRASTLKASA